MLRVENLAFAYRRGGEEIFNGLTYQFTPGAVTAVTGPSGRGKSTLLYLLGLMLSPAQGHVVLEGVEVDALSDNRRAAIRASSIGFVFQDAVLDSRRCVLDSVCEPALYAGLRRSEVQERARHLLTYLGIAERAEHRPGQISGGQAQRAAVARALLVDPVVILADEPTGNLDHASATTVLTTLAAVASGAVNFMDQPLTRKTRTVVIATHDPFVIEHANEVLEL